MGRQLLQVEGALEQHCANSDTRSLGVCSRQEMPVLTQTPEMFECFKFPFFKTDSGKPEQGIYKMPESRRLPWRMTSLTALKTNLTFSVSVAHVSCGYT